MGEKENIIDAAIVKDLKSVTMNRNVVEATTSEIDPDKECKDLSQTTENAQKSVVVGDSDKDKGFSDKPKNCQKSTVKNDTDESHELVNRRNIQQKSYVVVDNKDYDIPKGWSRKEVVRQSGKTAGEIDVYFYR